MSRPPFSLTDEQAGRLLMLVPGLNDKFPPGGPSNRLFVHEFIKAVHDATGRTFSPAIYRRLLDTYAPDRKPSTNTLALEKEAVERELANASSVPARAAHLSMPQVAQIGSAPAAAGAASSAEVVDLVRRAVEDVLERQLRHAGKMLQIDQEMAQKHIGDLSRRLAASDQSLAEARAHAAKLAAELHVASERQAIMQSRLQDAESQLREQREAHTRALEAVSAELSEIRKFAMRSIDDVRGETRAERERRHELEEVLKRNERLMEVFRQVAYQRGGTIPPELRMEQSR